MTTERPAQPNIQILRGLAALIVAVSHLPVDFYVAGIADHTKNLDFGVFGVDIFFVISGFIMVYIADGGRGIAPARRFFLRRLVRIAPLYWIFTTITLISVLHQFRHLGFGGYGWTITAMSYLFIPFSLSPGGIDMFPLLPVGWTLNYEMFFYVCFAAAMLLPNRVRFGVLAAALSALVAVGQVVALPQPLAFWARSNSLEFVFGMAITWALLRGIRLPSWAALLFALAGLAGAVAFRPYAGDYDRYRGLGWGIPAALIVAAAVLGRPRSGTVIGRAFLALGDASYSLYLLHSAAFEFLFALFEPGLRRHTVMPWEAMAIMLLATVVTAIILHRIVEAPMTRMLHRRFARRVPTPRTATTG